ncbi:MAG: flagellar biosynthesis protein FlgC [Desulfobacterales bacterium]|nr:flagellar biosynthesis protein FlgC [Deltaproteobacteria bacterium]NNK97147.1 flagellar biosynthesis protein FlgC [Desulfobacterales bacterium]
MISAFQSALSGLQAFGTKLHSNANNVANSSTEQFKRTRVLLGTDTSHRVATQVEKVLTPGTEMYAQTSKGEELVELSNVDLADELTEMNLNKTLYKANLKTIQVTDDMLGSLLKLKA